MRNGLDCWSWWFGPQLSWKRLGTWDFLKSLCWCRPGGLLPLTPFGIGLSYRNCLVLVSCCSSSRKKCPLYYHYSGARHSSKLTWVQDYAEKMADWYWHDHWRRRRWRSKSPCMVDPRCRWPNYSPAGCSAGRGVPLGEARHQSGVLRAFWATTAAVLCSTAVTHQSISACYLSLSDS